MRTRMFIPFSAAMLSLCSATVVAHVTGSGAVLPHIFTGDHLLMLIVVGVCVAVVSRFDSRPR